MNRHESILRIDFMLAGKFLRAVETLRRDIVNSYLITWKLKHNSHPREHRNKATMNVAAEFSRSKTPIKLRPT